VLLTCIKKLKYNDLTLNDMAKLVEMDDNVKFSSQLEEGVGPISLFQ
jgi:hypothetical protein